MSLSTLGRTQLTTLARTSFHHLRNQLNYSTTLVLNNYKHQHSTKLNLNAYTYSRKKVVPKAKYGGRHTVTMIPGSGIGPELMGYVKEVFRYAGIPVDFEIVEIGDNNEDLDFALTSIKRNGTALKGNIETTSLDPTIISRNVALRNELDLYANVVQLVTYPGVKTRHHNIDMVIIRANTEGEYALLEHESTPGVIECLKVITEFNATRIAKFAFNFARKNGRKKVTTIHKANIMKLSDGLFLTVSKEVARDFPEIEHDQMIIDNCCMQLVSKPHQFDVMLMPNLYGAIVSHIACGLLNGAGLISGRNFGDEYAVFEPGTRNTGSTIIGKNIANPISMMNAAVDMLDYLKVPHHARMLREAIHKTINIDKIHTPDLFGKATSIDVVNNIIEYLNIKSKEGNW